MYDLNRINFTLKHRP